ncbi:MAG TPA: hexose kinase [Gemmataceae bacterium]|nr:hexose kinase [Gemmataceae bacterium]
MILTAGLTPALQQILLFDALTLGEVNRARQVHWGASGKVLNAARALHHLGAECKTLTLVGGRTGESIRNHIAELGIPARWIEGNTPTRICTTLLDRSRRQATELVPNAAEATADELDRFRAAYAEEAATAAVVILIGSLPVGTPTGYYRDLLTHTPGKAILDARGPELLEALSARPFLVKPNRGELQQTLGRELLTDAELFDALREINERGAEWVVVTDGGKAVYARSRQHLYRLQPPPAEVVNPIGCGDCMAAGIAQGLLMGEEPIDAIRRGLAVAANKLGQLLPGFVQREQVEALLPSVQAVRV